MAKYSFIPGHPGYRAAVDGSLWSCWTTKGNGYGRTPAKVMADRWHRLKGYPRKEDGRLRYTLRRSDGSYRRAYGSHLVLEAFVGSCPEGMESCHNDGNCLNDALENLRWDTPESNRQDKQRHGKQPRGEAINTAKITAADVQEVRRVGKPLRQHAKRLGVSEALISAILRRKVWKHVE